jgi:hypothetical protein
MTNAAAPVIALITPLHRMAFLFVVGAGHDALPDLICHSQMNCETRKYSRFYSRPGR